MAENSLKKVPFSAKLGWVVTWVLMAVLFVMLSKNFVGSFIFGIGTDQQDIDKYYSLGLADAKGGDESRLLSLGLDNPLFKKAYKKGFRVGIDEKWQSEKK